MKLFGTDGIRGKYGQEVINEEFFFKIGVAIGRLLPRNSLILIGHDGRFSAASLQTSIVKGICHVNDDITIEATGLISTPALAFLVKRFEYTLGIMISASHNYAEDNGVKIINKDGNKLSDKEMNLLESYLMATDAVAIRGNEGKAKLDCIADAKIQEYLVYQLSILKSKFKNSFGSISIAMDCANGGVSFIVNQLVDILKTQATFLQISVINSLPDGYNINAECGSTNVNNLLSYIKKNNIDIGVAFDGDGDRVVLCTKDGRIVNGDQIICILHRELYLKYDIRCDIVGTVMSNFGLELAQQANGCNLIRTDVGDANVKRMLEELNLNIGGEQSGHIICKPYFKIGDGLACAMLLIGLYTASGKDVSEFFTGFIPVPQYLFNVRYNRVNFKADTLVKVLYEKYTLLAGAGVRVNIRKSGTEDLIRVMFEGDVDVATITENIENEKFL